MQIQPKYTYVYNNSNISTGGRSITIEDVNKITGYTVSSPVLYKFSKHNDGYIYFGENPEIKTIYTSFEYYNMGYDRNKTQNDWVTLEIGDTVYIPHNDYYYTINLNTNGANMIKYCDSPNNVFGYYLASKSIYIIDGDVDYTSASMGVVYAEFFIKSIRFWGSSNTGWETLVDAFGVFNSNSEDSTSATGIRPVITLQSNVVLTQKVNGVWQLGVRE